MMRVWSGVFPLGVLLLLIAAPIAGAEQDERDLFVRLPLHLDGDIRADAEDALVLLRATGDGGAPRISGHSTSFSAVSATAYVTNATYYDTPADGTGVPTDLLYRDEATTNTQVFGAVEIRLSDLGPETWIVATDGATEGARYSAVAEDRRAHLDVTDQPQRLSYTMTPQGLDAEVPLDAGTFGLKGANMLYTIEGDFELILFDTTVMLVPEQGGTSGNTYKTGRWTDTTVEEGLLPAGGTVRSTTIQYVRLVLDDASLALRASGGDQSLYAGDENMRLRIDGAMTTSGAVGSMQVDDQVVRSKGERTRMTGAFTLVPMTSKVGTEHWGFFTLQGDITTLSVGRTTYVSEGGLVAATGLAVILAGLAVYFLPALKSGLLVPLYAKLTKDKVLDQETRNLIHAKVAQDPGCQVNDVAEALQVSWTTAAYHLRVLRKMGIIVTRRRGRHEHFFVTGSPDTATCNVVSSLKNETARNIVEEILRHPGIIQKEICERLAIAPSTASWHLKRLIDTDAVREIRDWKMRRYYAGEALHQVPIHLGVTSEQVPVAASGA